MTRFCSILARWFQTVWGPKRWSVSPVWTRTRSSGSMQITWQVSATSGPQLFVIYLLSVNHLCCLVSAAVDHVTQDAKDVEGRGGHVGIYLPDNRTDVIESTSKRVRGEPEPNCRLEELQKISQNRTRTGAVFWPSTWRSKLCCCSSCQVTADAVWTLCQPLCWPLCRLLCWPLGWPMCSHICRPLCAFRSVSLKLSWTSCSTSWTQSRRTRDEDKTKTRTKEATIHSCWHWTIWTESSSWRSFMVLNQD